MTEFSLLDPRNFRTRVEYPPVMQPTRGSLGKPPPLEGSKMKVDLTGSFLSDASLLPVVVVLMEEKETKT